jgi:hypothetical protein
MTAQKKKPMIPEELKRKLQKRKDGLFAAVFGAIGIAAGLSAYYASHFGIFFYAHQGFFDALKLICIIALIMSLASLSVFVETKKALKGSFPGIDLRKAMNERELTAYALHVIREESFAVEDVVRAMEWLGSDKIRFNFARRIFDEEAKASPVVNRRLKIYDSLGVALGRKPVLGRTNYFSKRMGKPLGTVPPAPWSGAELNEATWLGVWDSLLEWLKAEGSLDYPVEQKAEPNPEMPPEFVEGIESPRVYNDPDSNEQAMDVIRQEVSDPELVVQAWRFLIRNNDIATFDGIINQLSQEAKDSEIVSSRLRALPAEDISSSPSRLDKATLTFEEATGVLLNPKALINHVLAAARWLKNNASPETRRKIIDSQPSKISDPKIALRLDWLKAEGLLDEPVPLPGTRYSRTGIRD